MIAKIEKWLAFIGVALTFIVSVFLYGRSQGKADADAKTVQRNAKSAAKARGVEDDVRKSSDADIDQRLTKWMRD